MEVSCLVLRILPKELWFNFVVYKINEDTLIYDHEMKALTKLNLNFRLIIQFTARYGQVGVLHLTFIL
jgi:hypothetical protein